MIFIITKTIHNITYYLGEKGWEGLIDNAIKLDFVSASQKILKCNMNEDDSISVKPYQNSKLN